jgi:hypothetical protein
MFPLWFDSGLTVVIASDLTQAVCSSTRDHLGAIQVKGFAAVSNRRVVGPITTLFGAAAACRRAAKFGVSPQHRAAKRFR